MFSLYSSFGRMTRFNHLQGIKNHRKRWQQEFWNNGSAEQEQGRNFRLKSLSHYLLKSLPHYFCGKMHRISIYSFFLWIETRHLHWHVKILCKSDWYFKIPFSPLLSIFIAIRNWLSYWKTIISICGFLWLPHCFKSSQSGLRYLSRVWRYLSRVWKKSDETYSGECGRRIYNKRVSTFPELYISR